MKNISKLRLIISAESIIQKKGGFFIYNPFDNKIEDYYIHDKEWKYRIGWRGCQVYKNYLIATDWTDLHYFNLEKWKYEKSFKKNTFNDLHYLKVFNDKLYVVNTGLDAIEIFKNPLEPEFKDMIFIFQKNNIFEKRKIKLNKNYNEKFKIKPHSCHPNSIDFSNDKIFVTCFQKQQKNNSGEIIELNSGERVLNNHYDCHDALIYNDDFYSTVTRKNKLLIIRNINERKFPVKDEELIDIGRGQWWRGMIIFNDFMFLFSSDGYRGKRTTVKILIFDLKTKTKIEMHKIPVVNNIYFDTVYQPQIFKV